jgi:hypothetical protein
VYALVGSAKTCAGHSPRTTSVAVSANATPTIPPTRIPQNLRGLIAKAPRQPRVESPRPTLSVWLRFASPRRVDSPCVVSRQGNSPSC